MVKISLFKVPIGELNGVNQKTEELFKKLKISSIGSLIKFYPIRYENWSIVKKIKDCNDPKDVVKIEVISNPRCIYSLYNKRIYKVECKDLNDQNSLLDVIFLNGNVTYKFMKKGEQFFLMGEIKSKSNGIYEIICPRIKSVNSKQNFEPIYSQVKGLSSYKIEKFVIEALKLLPEKIKDTIPDEILKKHDLVSLDFAIRKIHFPETEEDIKRANYRLNFDELMTWISSVKREKKEHKSKFFIENHANEFIKKLKFTLTNSQKKVIDLCTKDMSSGKSMMRLLQGDVGSGKTVVAMLLAYNTMKSGYQTALMVPTEILALQHYESFLEIFEKSSVRLLTSSTAKNERKRIILELKKGVPLVLIGTHSIISEDISFKNLAFVITDEQHKFGINQRQMLESKGDHPHSLVMSATPIPRSLATVLYGNMDFCTIDEMPLGRKKVQTFVVDSSMRERVFKFIKKQIDIGHQAYIVCAKVKKSKKNDIAIEDYIENITKKIFNLYKISTIHGKMKSDEKERIMKDFSDGKIDILVSTTVIEIGINVPNATVILVENAEKFGMATLHQMRGRVGRGVEQSYCILMHENSNQKTQERINTLSQSNDGLMLAAKDMILRGPGDLLSLKQHGFESSRMKLALMDQEMITRCISASESIRQLEKTRPT